MLYAPEAFRRHPCRVFASEPGLQGSPQKKSILQTSHSSPIGGGGVGKRKETTITVSISRERVGINNRRTFNPALIAAHSSIALRRRQLLKSLALDESNDYSNQRNNHCCNNVLQHRIPPSRYFLDIAFIPRYIRYPTTIAPTVVQNSRMPFCFLSPSPSLANARSIIAYPYRQYAILDVCGYPQTPRHATTGVMSKNLYRSSDRHQL